MSGSTRSVTERVSETELEEENEIVLLRKRAEELEKLVKKLTKAVEILSNKLDHQEIKFAEDLDDVQNQFYLKLQSMENDHHSISSLHENQSEKISDIIRASRIHVPILKNLEKSSIKKFEDDFNNYVRLSPKRSVLSVQDLITDKLVQVIKKKNLLTDEEYDNLSSHEIFEALCSIHNSISMNQSKDRLYAIKMKSEDMSMETLLNYVEEFEYEMKFIGTEYVVSDKSLAKIFVMGIKPVKLRLDVQNCDNESLDEAKDNLFRLVDDHLKASSIDNLSNRNSKFKQTGSGKRDSKPSNNKDNKDNSNQKPDKKTTELDLSTIECFRCHEYGHFANRCPNKREHRSTTGTTTTTNTKIGKNNKIVAVDPPIDTKKVSRSIVFEETFGVPREGHEKPENPEILGAAAVVSRNNGASLGSNHAITDINTTNDAHNDALLYISGYLWRDGVKVEQLSVKIFCDGGSSADIIKSRVLSDWEEKLGVKFPRVMGKPLALEMANKSISKVGSDRVVLTFLCHIDGKDVLVQRLFVIFEDSADDVVFSARIMRDLGLFALQQRSGIGAVDVCDFEEELRLSKWEHTIDDVAHILSEKNGD